MKNILLLPGDGIGPELTHAAQRVLERAAARWQLPIKLQQAPIGAAALDAEGAP